MVDKLKDKVQNNELLKKTVSANTSFLKEFKEFALKGNIIDLAIGVVIGAAFGKIVSSLVGDIITPLINILTNSKDVESLFVVNVKSAKIPFGKFVETIIDFLVTAFAVFLFIKLLIKFKIKEKAAPPKPLTPSKEELLLTEIRDLLKERKL
jgi:large conductance mechanosensitive channel